MRCVALRGRVRATSRAPTPSTTPTSRFTRGRSRARGRSGCDRRARGDRPSRGRSRAGPTTRGSSRAACREDSAISARASRSQAAQAVTTDPLLARRAAPRSPGLTPLDIVDGVDDAHEGSSIASSARPAIRSSRCASSARSCSRTRVIRARWRRCSRSRAVGSATAASMMRGRGSIAPRAALSSADREHVTAERARFELRGGESATARASIAALRDPQLRAQLDHELARADGAGGFA